jgi:putative aminopeptidase FrvX
MNLFEKIKKIAEKGYFIQYDIMDQKENGYGKQVEKNDLPKVTFSVFVMHICNYEVIHIESFDSLEEGLINIIKYTEKNLI